LRQNQRRGFTPLLRTGRLRSCLERAGVLRKRLWNHRSRSRGRLLQFILVRSQRDGQRTGVCHFREGGGGDTKEWASCLWESGIPIARGPSRMGKGVSRARR
ncbi:unnamed protein product, partial [Scytosiphon promiscuus]